MCVIKKELSETLILQLIFLKRLAAEFNWQQTSPSADVTQNAVTLECDAWLLLASETSMLHKNLDMKIFYEPVTLLKTLIEKQ